MSVTSILIPSSTVLSFSDDTRAEIFAAMGLQGLTGARSSDTSAEVVGDASGETEGPPDLTVAMARKLIADPINPRSKTALRVIAEGASATFHMKDIIAAIPEIKSYLELRANWAGITRRVRKILGDEGADLIWWNESGEFDGDMYVDHIGRVSPLTHRSLRSAFGL